MLTQAFISQFIINGIIRIGPDSIRVVDIVTNTCVGLRLSSFNIKICVLKMNTMMTMGVNQSVKMLIEEII